MAKNLVIVESPAKVKTIKKFLGKNYSVVASMGHVRDLPKSQMGIDIDNDFEPKYITIRGKGELLSELRKEAKKADTIYLATDPDREGEAISWHLRTALKLDGADSKKKVERITFNEITKTAVKNSLKSPRDIDMNLVDAQQARRVLDRMVGYSISPLLWAKVKRGLSAGRVQSVALRIICERESEIDAFIPEEYWTIEGSFGVKGEKKPIEAKFHGSIKEKIAIGSKDEADAIIKYCKKADFKVTDVKNGERVRKSPLPFTTSTMQQEASSVLNFATQKTMRIAQQLYEEGLISYLRTDSTRISDDAKEMAADYIEKNYGNEYLAEPNRKKSDDKKIQDAHEAIRPTDLEKSPVELKDSLSRDQFRLYQLIWKRFIASQMAPAKYATKNVKIQAGDKYLFTASASKVKFAGFMNVYTESGEEKVGGNVISGEISTESIISLDEINGKQHFTNPSPHYTEASLVKALEELGIGRPSTYAPTITTLLARRYVTKEQKNLYVTEIGTAVDKILEEAFPGIVDVNFTANFETLLDGVEAGKVKWKTIIENFYPDLEKAVEKAEKEIEEVEIRDEVTDVICEECGRNMVVKYGPHGKFLGCPGFPECRNTKPYYEKIGVKCPKCGNEIVMRMTNKGRRFYGCLGYPECDFTSWPRPSKKSCPDCGGMMVEKGKKLVCINEECKKVIDREEEED